MGKESHTDHHPQVTNNIYLGGMKFICLVFCVFISCQWSAQTDSTISQKGIASYYAKKFEGRRCSSGEVFRHDSLTAAHKYLPYGTYVKVTNTKNDSVVVVRINDRLPKNSKRCIDLTISAAKQLNFLVQGLTPVNLVFLNDSLACLKK